MLLLSLLQASVADDALPAVAEDSSVLSALSSLPATAAEFAPPRDWLDSWIIWLATHPQEFLVAAALIFFPILMLAGVSAAYLLKHYEAEEKESKRKEKHVAAAKKSAAAAAAGAGSSASSTPASSKLKSSAKPRKGSGKRS